MCVPASNWVVETPVVTEVLSTNSGNDAADSGSPKGFRTIFVTVSVGATSLFVIEHTVVCPFVKLIWLFVTVTLLVHVQRLAAYPAGPALSLREYVPAENVGPLGTSVLPAAPGPDIGVGPVAVSVQAFSVAVPPCVLLTSLLRVREGAMSSLIIVQTVVWPFMRVI